MHLSVKLIFREQSQMTTKAGQAPPIGSSHLGISGGTCHSSGSAPRSEGLHSWSTESFLGAGLGKGGRGSSSAFVAINLQLGSFLMALVRGKELASPFVLALFPPMY